ncbi:MAG: valine--tRNA ligase [bacterium]|nr:valine--tRNA ligase [bacterium]
MPKKDLPKSYNPADYEDEIYAQWEKSGFFNPDNLTGEPYSIMMPPPNVTGVLHLGHALENSLMDITARYQRMNGKKVLLAPGTDHAAVATQAKVEKLLVAEGMKNPRQELGREKLLEKIREYAEASKATILSQIKKMGTSCDWSRLAYTFDEPRNKAVNEVFIRMYNDGLVYRGHRVVNWSVKGQSTSSDDELIYMERPAKLWTFKYSKDFPLAIASTRPETKLGDTAVAVNPKDKRYKKYIGQIFTADVGAAKPLRLKVIADPAVDMNFGTGAIGVTPAHSAVDFLMYEKQKAQGQPIDLIQVISQDGKMTAAAGQDYAGLTAEQAREKFVAWLKENDLLVKEEDITQSVGTSDRFGDVVEALPMTQWFVDVNKKIPARGASLKEMIKQAIVKGHHNDAKQKIDITPERFEKVVLNWLDNLHDWCISRQIWWGHRIPVYYRRQEISNISGFARSGRARQYPISNEMQNANADANAEEILVSAEKPEGGGWEQDPDTLDTWFSSGMWTFSTLGGPEKSPLPPPVKGGKSDLKTFHPSNWMQMGYEIIFLWMVRMILMSTYALDQIPFKDVYIHGMLRDQSGKKFSKSSGNNIDPLEVIKQYGSDALRFSLVSGISPGNDSRFYAEKVEGARNLVNKLWNVARYIITNFSGYARSGEARQFSILNFQLNAEKLTLADKWILDKLEKLISGVTDDLDNFRFSQAGEKLRVFTWDDLADWYLEISKFEQGKNEILYFILESLLKLWHPFMPFVTEAIWRELGKEKLLMAEKWADITPPTPLYKGGSEQFELIKDVVAAIRNARSVYKIEPNQKIKAVICSGKRVKLIEEQSELIKKLRTGIEELEIENTGEKVEQAIYLTVSGVEIYLAVPGFDFKAEADRLAREIKVQTERIKSLSARLANKEFTSKAPANIVKAEKDKLDLYKSELGKLKEQRSSLK